MVKQWSRTSGRRWSSDAQSTQLSVNIIDNTLTLLIYSCIRGVRLQSIIRRRCRRATICQPPHTTLERRKSITRHRLLTGQSAI